MEFESYLRFLFALVFVLALIVLAAWGARRLGLGGAMPASRGRGKRLSVVETLTVDARRRLVLVRRDDVEHLILLGPQSDLLVESNLAAPAPSPTDGPETPP